MSKAIITNNIDKLLEEIQGWEVIRKDEIKIDDVNYIKQKAYIADKEKRLIIIAAEKFNIYAQNALLKLIEEPPKNIDFIIVTNSKHSLLDTILSRVIIEKKFYESEDDFELKPVTNEYILDLLTSNLQKEDIKKLLKAIIKKKKLSDETLKVINDAVLMLELNLDKEAVIALVMLSLKVDNANIQT